MSRAGSRRRAAQRLMIVSRPTDRFSHAGHSRPGDPAPRTFDRGCLLVASLAVALLGAACRPPTSAPRPSPGRAAGSSTPAPREAADTVPSNSDSSAGPARPSPSEVLRDPACGAACAPKHWRGAETIDPGAVGVSARRPRIAMDHAGNGIVVWYREVGRMGTGSVLARRFHAESNAWTSTVEVERDREDARVPEIAMASNGGAAAVWLQSQRGRTHIHAALYDVATESWRPSASLEPTSREVSDGPAVDISPRGHVIVAWERYNGRTFGAFVARFDAEAGEWGRPQLLERGPGGSRGLDVAVDVADNAFVVWHSYGGDRPGAHAARFEAATGRWSNTVYLGGADEDVWFPQVAACSSGHAVVVWRQSGKTLSSVYYTRFDVSTANLRSPELLASEATGPVVGCRVGKDVGASLAVWQEATARGARGTTRIHAKGLDGGSWPDATFAAARDNTKASSPRVAVDLMGNAVIAWEQRDDKSTDIIAAHYDISADRWSEVERLNSDEGGRAEWVDVSMSANGTAIAVWNELHGSQFTVHANRLE